MPYISKKRIFISFYLRFSTRILNEMCEKEEKIFLKNQNMTEKIHKNFMMMIFVFFFSVVEILLLDFLHLFCFLVIFVLGSLMFFFLMLNWNRWAWENFSSKNIFFFCFSFQNIFTKHLLLNRFYAQLFWNFAYRIGLFCCLSSVWLCLENVEKFGVLRGYGVQLG